MIVDGVVSLDEYNGNGQLQIRARNVVSFNEARHKYIKNITLDLHQENMSVESLPALQEILAEFGAGQHIHHHDHGRDESEQQCDVVVHYSRKGVQGNIRLGKQWRVQVEDELLHRLRQQYGKEYISVNYH